MTAFMRRAAAEWGAGIRDYAALYERSLSDPERFWRLMWEFGELRGDMGARVIERPDAMPGARFFPDASLNFAENLLRRRDDTPAIFFRGEEGPLRVVSWAELYAGVAGVRRGAARRRHPSWRSGRGIRAQRTGSRDCRARQRRSRRRLVVLFSGFRRPRRTRSVRADRTARARHRRCLSLRRAGARFERQGARDCRGPAVGRAGCRDSVLWRRAAAGPGAGANMERFPCQRPGAIGIDSLRAAAVQSSALRDVLVRHHRGAEMHRPRRRRHADPARQGASAALRHPRRRPRLLLHDVRLDDVELARLGPGVGCRDRALRRLAVSSRRPRPLRLCRRVRRDPLRHLSEVPRRRVRKPASRRSRRTGSRPFGR